MGSPEVRQLEFLSAVFGRVLEEFDPAAVAVLGCATGNGFDRVRPERVKRLVGLDINQEYLDKCRKRYGRAIPGLELVCADVATFELEPGSMDLVHAALFFEYVEPAVVVEKASRWLRPGGILAAVLQLPSETHGKVSETRFSSLRALEPVIHLLEPATLVGLARRRRFSETRSERVALGSGKEFFVGVYRLETAHE
jgi:SAM-dependent methyltransferase